MKFLVHNEDNPAEAPGICLLGQEHEKYKESTDHWSPIVIHGFGYCSSYTFISWETFSFPALGMLEGNNTTARCEGHIAPESDF